MPSKQAKRRNAAKQRDALEFRGLTVRAETVNAESRTVETVVSTEAPVPMMDWERWEIIPEVLRADGAILPDQVPLLDSHQRYSMENQYGSTRSLSRQKDQIVGTLHFSSDESAVSAFNKVREGHATDVSAGYQVLEKTHIPRGQKATVAGREYTGPVNVVTKWRLREVSLTPIGADEQAKLRGLDASQLQKDEGFTMNEQLRALLESRGMPTGLSDDDAQRWAVDNNFGERNDGGGVDTKKLIDDARAAFMEDLKKLNEADRKKAEELKARSESLLKISRLERTAELSAKLDACRCLEDVEKAILDAQTERDSKFPTSPVVSAGPQASEKFIGGMRTALIMRAMGEVESVPSAKSRAEAVERVYPAAQRSEHAKQFHQQSLYEMARNYCETIYGIRTFDFSREQVAAMAMFGPTRAAEILGFEVRDAAYHVTGSFANLTRDAMNKSMLLGYTEAPSTWEMVMRRGASVPDFKNINRMRLGAIPNLPVWADNTNPEKASVADAREVYAVESRSLEINFSYRLLINDDMDALSRLPGQMGNAARRTVNTYGWSIITSNPTMSDSVALFSGATGARKRQNLTTGAGAPSVTTVAALTNLMRQMRGENTPEGEEGKDILSLSPYAIVAPSALELTVNQLVNSAYDPSASLNTMVFNPTRTLMPVIEPLLDSSSTTAWYLFANPNQIDTVEISFLQGQETPVVRQTMDEKTLSQSWTILQTFGGKAMNHRGIQKHAGA